MSTGRHTSAYVSIVGIRQHTSAYVSIRQHPSASVSIRQHTAAYVSIRQHLSASVSMRQTSSASVSMRQHTSAYVIIRQHTSYAPVTFGCQRRQGCYGSTPRYGRTRRAMWGNIDIRRVQRYNLPPSPQPLSSGGPQVPDPTIAAKKKERSRETARRAHQQSRGMY